MVRQIFWSMLIICLFYSFGLPQGFQPIANSIPVSFRSQALGGTIFDDLDLVYDPIELRFVNGIRFYTNLSNLTSNKEQILNDASDNEFLFGSSWKNRLVFDLWTSFLVRYQKSRFSNPVSINSDLFGGDDIFGEGNLSNVYNAFLDTSVPPDGLYDIKQSISQEKSDFSNDRMRTYVLNNSFLASGLTLGLQIIHGKEIDEETTASGVYGRGPVYGATFGDPSYSLNYNRYLVQEDMFMDFARDEKGDFLTKDEHTFTHFYASAMKPFYFFPDTMEFRLDLGYMKENSKFNLADEFSGRNENYNRDIVGYLDRYTENESFSINEEEDGSGFYLGFSTKMVFDRGKERKDDGFWRAQFGLTRLNFDYNYNQKNPFLSEDQFFDGSDTLLSDQNLSVLEEINIADAGDGTSTRYMASGLVNVPLNKKVSVGMGGFLSIGNLDRKTKYSNNFNLLEDFEEVDTLNSNDYKRTVTESKNANRTFEIREYHFIFPVGIEYKFTNNGKWCLRFGSIFSYTRTETNDVHEITDSRPMIETKEYGDGRIEESIDDNINESLSRHTSDARSSTSFVYGLGFNPNENLQIDLLGFLGSTSGEDILDTQFYRKLRLSFTLKL